VREGGQEAFTPCTPDDYITPSTKASIRIRTHATTDIPDLAGIDHGAGTLVAKDSAKIHVPRDGRIQGSAVKNASRMTVYPDVVTWMSPG